MARWDDLFGDLEGRWREQDRAEELGSVPDRVRRDRAGQDLSGRVAAAVGARVDVVLPGRVRLGGLVDDVGPGWASLLLPTGGAEGGRGVVLLDRVVRLEGLPSAARPHEVGERRTAGSALRVLLRDRRPVRVHDVEGEVLEGVLAAVGKDHLDLCLAPRDLSLRDRRAARRVTLPLAAVAAVRQV